MVAFDSVTLECMVSSYCNYFRDKYPWNQNRALTRFHNREIDSLRVEIKQWKKTDHNIAVNSKSKSEPAHSAQIDIDVNIENLKSIATNIQSSVAQCSVLMGRLSVMEIYKRKIHMSVL